MIKKLSTEVQNTKKIQRNKKVGEAATLVLIPITVCTTQFRAKRPVVKVAKER